MKTKFFRIIYSVFIIIEIIIHYIFTKLSIFLNANQILETILEKRMDLNNTRKNLDKFPHL